MSANDNNAEVEDVDDLDEEVEEQEEEQEEQDQEVVASKGEGDDGNRDPYEAFLQLVKNLDRTHDHIVTLEGLIATQQETMEKLLVAQSEQNDAIIELKVLTSSVAGFQTVQANTVQELRSSVIAANDTYGTLFKKTLVTLDEVTKSNKRNREDIEKHRNQTEMSLRAVKAKLEGPSPVATAQQQVATNTELSNKQNEIKQLKAELIQKNKKISQLETSISALTGSSSPATPAAATATATATTTTTKKVASKTTANK